jgi:hypothetical protein
VKLSELDELRVTASTAASTQARTLAVAGLALVWLFAGPFYQRTTGAVRPSKLLLLAGALLALAIALDLIQLYARTALLGAAFTRREKDPAVQKELEAGNDPTVTDLGASVNIISAIFFYAKALPLAAGYGLIFAFFIRAL